MKTDAAKWLGRSLERREDAALLRGAGRFMADLSPLPGLRHAAVLRSPHAHAEIRGVDVSRAEAAHGVVGVLTGRDVSRMSEPFANVLRLPAPYYPCAVDRVRFFGEPVAVVVAEDRYLAEDALTLIEVDYRPLPAVVDPEAALAPDAPVLHPDVRSNCAHHRQFRYGDPEAAFAKAARIVKGKWRYPRVNSTPIETYGVIANFETAPDRYTVWSNFQGPFVLQLLMSGALRVPSTRLRLITPPFSGGSFGIKQGIYPYIVLMALASRKTGVPVKWIEDRLEHLAASSASTERVTQIEGAFAADGALLGLRLNQLDNVGAYLRPPEPATLYRMHGNLNGPYRVRDIAVANTVVLTNQLPAGLNRGYGGPQAVFPLERLMDRAAAELGLDPAEIRRKNFVAAGEFPYECASGLVLDSGDFHAVLDRALARAGYDALQAERTRARTEGRLFGIGIAASVETSVSSLAYVNTAVDPAERARASPKSGGAASASVMIDPSGGVVVRTYSIPNGQGHATTAAQIVADELGIRPETIEVVTEVDTALDPWSITSGNYANRFSAAVTSAVALAARRVADKLRRVAAAELRVEPEQVELANGMATARGGRNRPVPIARLAAKIHWDSSRLPNGVEGGVGETATFTPPDLLDPDAGDRIRAALTTSFLCDVAAVEVAPETGRVTVKRYATVHDIGRVLNPALVEGQVRGGFAHGVGAALFERIAYAPTGTLLSATFADYLCPTAPEMPPLEIDHLETASPNTVLGSKGLGDGSSMNAPAAICNAVADAIGRFDIAPPLTPARVWAWLHNVESESGVPAAGIDRQSTAEGGPRLTGRGERLLPMPPETAWARLLDPQVIASALPGCKGIVPTGTNQWHATVEIRVAGIGGTYEADLAFVDLDPPTAFRLIGRAEGRLGAGEGEARVALRPEAIGTRLHYEFSSSILGPAAAFGHRFLNGVIGVLIDEFFAALVPTAGAPPRIGIFRRWLNRLAILWRAWRKA